MWSISMTAPCLLFRISVFAFCPLLMHAQTANTGAIAGSVSDPSWAPVAGAAVVIDSEATREQRDLNTDAEGNFSVPFLTPCNYELTVRSPRFEPLILKNVHIQITKVNRLKIH